MPAPTLTAAASSARSAESHAIVRIDLARMVGSLSHSDLLLLVYRNVLGLSWSDISRLTRKDRRQCVTDFKLALRFLAHWLRAYYGPVARRSSLLPRLRRRSVPR